MIVVCHLILVRTTPRRAMIEIFHSGVGSNCSLRGPQIQVVGVALIIEFYDHNIPFLKVIHC